MIWLYTINCCLSYFSGVREAGESFQGIHTEMSACEGGAPDAVKAYNSSCNSNIKGDFIVFWVFFFVLQPSWIHSKLTKWNVNFRVFAKGKWIGKDLLYLISFVRCPQIFCRMTHMVMSFLCICLCLCFFFRLFQWAHEEIWGTSFG